MLIVSHNDGHLSIQPRVLIVLLQFCKKMWVSKHMDLPLTSSTENICLWILTKIIPFSPLPPTSL